MPDWLRTTVWIVGVLALLLTLVIGYLMWRYRIPPRGLFAMGAAAVYLISPIDLLPEAILGPLGLVDDAGVLAAVALFVYKLVKARRILADGGIELRERRRRGSPIGADRSLARTRRGGKRRSMPRCRVTLEPRVLGPSLRQARIRTVRSALPFIARDHMPHRGQRMRETQP